MCDNCSERMDELLHAELEPEEIAGIALATLGVLIEDYCEQDYCDPTMYRALRLAEILAKKLGNEELTTRLGLAKILAGEVVNEMIDRHNIPVDKDKW